MAPPGCPIPTLYCLRRPPARTWERMSMEERHLSVIARKRAPPPARELSESRSSSRRAPARRGASCPSRGLLRVQIDGCSSIRICRPARADAQGSRDRRGRSGPRAGRPGHGLPRRWRRRRFRHFGPRPGPRPLKVIPCRVSRAAMEKPRLRKLEAEAARRHVRAAREAVSWP